MGEMADMTLDEVMDMEEMRFEYRSGRMNPSEAYDAGIIDEHGAEPHATVVEDDDEDEDDAEWDYEDEEDDEYEDDIDEDD